MTPISKSIIALSTFLLGIPAAGGTINHMLKTTPDHTFLYQNSKFSTLYTTDTLGASNDNKNIFIDPDNNSPWWDWAYRLRVKKISAESTEFKAVKSGYSDTSSEALNKTCKQALTKKKKEAVYLPYKRDIWRYCTKYGLIFPTVTQKPEPKVLDTSDDDKYSGIDANKGKFVDSDGVNEEWWNWIYSNYLKVVLDDENKKKEALSESFKSIDKGYHSSDTNALSQVCRTAVDKNPKTVVEIKYKKNIWEYCSKKREVPGDIDKPPSFYTLDHERNSDNKIEEQTKLGGYTQNKSRLVADIEANEEIWNWVYENKLKIEKSGTSSTVHSNFNSVTKGYSKDSSDSTSALNKVCSTAHSKGKSDLDSDADYKKNIERYCSNNRTEGDLYLPEASTQV